VEEGIMGCKLGILTGRSEMLPLVDEDNYINNIR